MASVAWLAVKDHLVSALPAVLGASVTVYDGPTVTGENPPAYMTVGLAPSQGDGSSSGSFEQSVGPDGYSVEERGSVVCELGALTGLSVVPDVFTSFAAVASLIQSDQTLGGALDSASTVMASADVVQAQSNSGAVQRLVISINYFTRL